MKAFTNILVPLDGSILAEKALPVAAEAVSAAGGRLTLLVVVEAESARELQRYAQVENLLPAEAAQIYVDQVASWLVSEGIEAQKETSSGTNAAEEILSYAESAESSMIVMSSHGRSGISRWLLGSVTDKVMRSSSIPVLVVPCRPGS